MVKVRKAGVETPCLYLIDSSNSKICMEKIDGITAKQFFLDCLESKFFRSPAQSNHVVFHECDRCGVVAVRGDQLLRRVPFYSHEEM